ncbi:MAG: VanW family protein [Clostridia bacterium]|nr:VanW family protein [Clostridia bacterium]
MQIEQNTQKKSRALMIVGISVGSVILALVICFFAALFIILGNSHIYNGIYIGKVAVGGMSTYDAGLAVSDYYSPSLTKVITLRHDEVEETLDLATLGARVDVDKTIDRAYNTARTGNIFKRFKEIIQIKREGLTLPPILACNEDAVIVAIERIAALVDQPGRDMELAIGENELTITRGAMGYQVNQPLVLNEFLETTLTLSSDVFPIELEAISPTTPDASALYDELCGEAVDASYKIENQRLVITDEKVGIVFDKSAAQAIIDATLDQVIVIPIQTTLPAVTAEQIRADLFCDQLGYYSTKYNAGDVPRSHNVALASQKINEVVLAPGDVFSYNDTVGPRTTERGFRVANVYVGNRVEPGVGGGICQVSSTLYNAVVLADLKIETRTNHSLPVTYVPLGRDATVSYGSIDFKFSNNTEAPIKIVASAGGGINKIAIYGTKENKNKTIEISSQCIATSAPKLLQKEDPTLPEGTVEVEQKGANGSTYNTYKITKENGKVVKSEFLAKSTYVASDRIEIIGTAPVAVEEPTEPGTGSVVNPDPSDAPAVEEPPTDIPTVTPIAPNAQPDFDTEVVPSEAPVVTDDIDSAA